MLTIKKVSNFMSTHNLVLKNMNMSPKRFSYLSFYECCLLNIVDGGDDVFVKRTIKEKN